MLDEFRRPVHDLLQHRPEPPSFRRVANRPDVAGQSQLADQAQAVVGERSQMQDGVVGVEFAGRQAFQPQIALDFGMKLLVRAMMPIQIDDFIRRQVEAGPPAFQLDFREQEALPFLADGTFGDPDHEAEGALGLLPGAVDLEIQESLSFSRTYFGEGARFFGHGHPAGFVLPSRIPLGDEFEAPSEQTAAVAFLGFGVQQSGAVEAAVLAHQHRLIRRHQSFHPRKHAFVEVLGLAGGMTLAGAQLQPDVPAFIPEIGRNRGIPVDSLISATDEFLFRVAVVHHERVDVQANKVLVRRDRRLRPPQKAQGQVIGQLPQLLGLDVEPLTHPHAARYFRDAQRFLEKTIAPEFFNGLEIAFAQAQQPNERLDQIRCLHALRHRQLAIDHEIHLGRFTAASDQCQSRMRGQPQVPALTNFEFRHVRMGEE